MECIGLDCDAGMSCQKLVRIGRRMEVPKDQKTEQKKGA